MNTIRLKSFILRTIILCFSLFGIVALNACKTKYGGPSAEYETIRDQDENIDNSNDDL